MTKGPTKADPSRKLGRWNDRSRCSMKRFARRVFVVNGA